MKEMRRIFILTGFRGSGKTTIGKLLAKKLQCAFFDTDAICQKAAGKTIYSITRAGKYWNSFRKLEHAVFRKALKHERSVISTGGGLLVNPLYGKRNFVLVKKLGGTIILLQANQTELKKRIARQELSAKTTVRPLLRRSFAYKQKICKKEMVAIILKDALIVNKQRKSLYKKISDISINTSNKSPKKIVRKLAGKLTK